MLKFRWISKVSVRMVCGTIFLVVLVLVIHSPLYYNQRREADLTFPCETASQTNKASGKQRKVIIMSYMRSGSSFTGRFFERNPAVYYLFEPLLYTGDRDIVNRGTPISARLSSAMVLPDNPPKALDYLLTLLRCNMTVHDMRFYQTYKELWAEEEVEECQSGSKDVATLTKCLPGVLHKCRSSQAVVEKVLRLKMWEIDELLNCDPELKVIHLVRDPRGMGMSRTVIGYYFNPDTFCQRLFTDAILSQKLAKKYPGRLFTVRYEDIASSPIKMAQLLYTTTDIPWTEDAAKSLSKEIAKKDPSTTSVEWRKRIDFELVKRMQTLCQESMELYGYNRFDNIEQVRDFDLISSFRSDYSNEFNKLQVTGG